MHKLESKFYQARSPGTDKGLPSTSPSPLHFCAGNIINFMLAENEGLIFLWIKHLDQTNIFCKSLLTPKKVCTFFLVH